MFGWSPTPRSFSTNLFISTLSKAPATSEQYNPTVLRLLQRHPARTSKHWLTEMNSFAQLPNRSGLRFVIAKQPGQRHLGVTGCQGRPSRCSCFCENALPSAPALSVVCQCNAICVGRPFVACLLAWLALRRVPYIELVVEQDCSQSLFVRCGCEMGPAFRGRQRQRGKLQASYEMDV